MTKTITPPIARRAQTGPAEHAWLEGPANQQREERGKWASLLAATLARWEKDPENLDDGESELPSIEVIWRAINGAGNLRVAERRAPTRIVPTANGAISFEWQDGPMFESLTFDDAGFAEWKQFRSGRLVARQRVQ